MTPAAVATAIRDAVESGCRKDPAYRELVIRELAEMGRAIPVPAEARERGWADLKSEIRADMRVSVCPQPVVGQNAGQHSPASRPGGLIPAGVREGN